MAGDDYTQLMSSYLGQKSKRNNPDFSVPQVGQQGFNNSPGAYGMGDTQSGFDELKGMQLQGLGDLKGINPSSGGGVDGKYLGGPWNALAGMVGTGIQAANPTKIAEGNAENVSTYGADVGSISYNKELTSMANYDFNSEYDKLAGETINKDMQLEDNIKGTVEKMPVIGGFATLGRGLHGLWENNINVKEDSFGSELKDVGSMLFDPIGFAKKKIDKAKNPDLYDPEKIEERKRAEYEDVAANEMLASNQLKYNSIFADGGYLDIFANNDSESLLAMGGETYGNGGDVQEIEAGMPHEQDAMNGIEIGNGNKAEVGEVVVNLPKGEFVFTNRF